MEVPKAFRLHFFRYVTDHGDGHSEYQCLKCKGRLPGVGYQWKYCPLCGVEWLGERKWDHEWKWEKYKVSPNWQAPPEVTYECFARKIYPDTKTGLGYISDWFSVHHACRIQSRQCWRTLTILERIKEFLKEVRFELDRDTGYWDDGYKVEYKIVRKSSCGNWPDNRETSVVLVGPKPWVPTAKQGSKWDLPEDSEVGQEGHGEWEGT